MAARSDHAFALLLAAALLLATPARAQDMVETAVPGTAGVPMEGPCLSNPDEMAGPRGDVLYMPNDGCAATFDLAGLGAQTILVTGIDARILGAEGTTMCGWFEFAGAAVGRSQMMCTEVSQGGRLAARTVDGEGAELLVTFHSTVATNDIEVCSITLEHDGDEAPVPAPDCFHVAAQPPAVCEELWVEATADGSLTVTLPAYEGATSVWILQRLVAEGQPGFERVADLPGDATSYTATGLLAGGTYGFAVAYQDDDGTAPSCVGFGIAGGEHAEVPEFPTLLSMMAAFGAVLVLAIFIANRRKRDD